MTPISKRQRAHLYMYKNQKNRNVYKYIQKARYCTKSKIICVTFSFTKIHTLYVTRFFMKFLKVAFIYIQKAWHFALRYVFIYKNPDTSKKARKFALRLYIYKNPDAWRYTIYHGIFEIGGGEGGGEEFLWKKNALCIKFQLKKKHFPLRFYLQKAQHFVLHFHMQKPMQFALRFISKICRIVYYDT